ncbi:MAG: VCBS repeat-containing protein, partial [Bacteroidota bacterium]
MTNFSAIHSVWKGFFLAILFAIVGTGTTHSQSFTDITSTLFTSIPPAKSGGDIIVADLNQDNFLDLTLVGPGSATEVYSYSTGSFIPVPNAVSLPDVDNSQPGVADIDGDGNLDLLFVGNDGFSRYAQIILNQGGGNFIAGTSFPSSAVGEGANSF